MLADIETRSKQMEPLEKFDGLQMEPLEKFDGLLAKWEEFGKKRRRLSQREILADERESLKQRDEDWASGGDRR